MAVNFRLSANTGYDYTDLLPRTAMQNIEDVDDILKYSEIRLKVPASDAFQQQIAQVLTAKQAVAPFDVDLLTKGPDAIRAYFAIDQIASSPSGFTITRLYAGSDVDIELLIRFKERGIDGE